MKLRLPSALALAILSCGRPQTYDDKRAKVHTYMETAEHESTLILEDLKKNRGQDSIRSRLAAIRRNLQSAQALQYRQVAAENEEMAGYFSTFYTKLDLLEKEDWTGGDGPRFWDKLQFQCSVCHGRFRDE